MLLPTRIRLQNYPATVPMVLVRMILFDCGLLFMRIPHLVPISSRTKKSSYSLMINVIGLRDCYHQLKIFSTSPLSSTPLLLILSTSPVLIDAIDLKKESSIKENASLSKNELINLGLINP